MLPANDFPNASSRTIHGVFTEPSRLVAPTPSVNRDGSVSIAECATTVTPDGCAPTDITVGAFSTTELSLGGTGLGELTSHLAVCKASHICWDKRKESGSSFKYIISTGAFGFPSRAAKNSLRSSRRGPTWFFNSSSFNSASAAFAFAFAISLFAVSASFASAATCNSRACFAVSSKGRATHSAANSIPTPNATNAAAASFATAIADSQDSALANAEASIERSRFLSLITFGLVAVWLCLRLLHRRRR
jgi:hypothetical protein